MSKIKTPEMERINARIRTKDGKVREYSFWREAWFRLSRNRTAVIGMIIILMIILCAVLAGILSPYDPTVADYMAAKQPPSAEHWFGTDNLGRDIFSRCMYAARVSFPLGVICAVLGLICGGFIGMIAAFFGGKVDNILMRIVDVFQSIPGMLMAIVVVATLGSGTTQLLLALTISMLPSMSKTVRAAIFTVRGNEYMEASRSVGASNMRLMLVHAFPNAIGHIIIFAVGMISASIMIISSLSYIGLGIQPPTPEWGAMLSTGKDYMQSSAHMVLFPGLMIMITVLGFNLFADGLRDALDPRLK